MNLNNLGISARYMGSVDSATGTVTVTKLYSYDLVAMPGFSGATFADLYDREVERQKLLASRREKIERLNKLAE